MCEDTFCMREDTGQNPGPTNDFSVFWMDPNSVTGAYWNTLSELLEFLPGTKNSRCWLQLDQGR